MSRMLHFYALLSMVGGFQAFAADDPARTTLRSVFADDFLIGVALNTSTVDDSRPRESKIAARQFSSLTAGNDMKWQGIQPQPERFDFPAADAYVESRRKYNMAVIGHTLVWHSQTPDWMFQSFSGDDAGREFDILVNDKVITTQELEREKPNNFIEKRYPIPTGIISSHSNGRLTVKFAAKQWVAGGLHDVRLLKPGAHEISTSN